MDTLDKRLLSDMRREIDAYKTGQRNLMTLADRLLALRDLLELQDQEWKDRLTDHLVTLDSGATFTPASDAEKQQSRLAVSEAIKVLECLLEAKADELT